jgi:Ser/Thr protein kinase RdoA (MazF antagonist)
MNAHQLGAAAAARVVARRYGIRVPQPRLLEHGNNTVVHLAPLPLVAKVAGRAGRPARASKLRTELEIASHLVDAGAPIAAPSGELPAEVHREGDHALTFWRYHEHHPRARIDHATACGTLEAVHRALDTYGGALSSFLDRQVTWAGRILADPNALPTLPAADRAFLKDERSRLTATLADRHLPCRTLHGDPHRGNFLVTANGCMMIDFESACSGPVEWDLSALPGHDALPPAGLFPVDPELLVLLRRLRSVCVAVWCCAHEGRSIEIDRASRAHLERLRRPVSGGRGAVPSAPARCRGRGTPPPPRRRASKRQARR